MARIKGFDDLRNRIDRLGRNFEKELQIESRGIIRSAQSLIALKAPRGKTGRLSKNVRIEELQRFRRGFRGWRVFVPVKPTFYGRFQNFGTKRGIKAREFFFSVWNSLVTSASGQRAMLEKMEKVFKKQTGG